MYGILIKAYHSLKIKRKWMSDDDQRVDVPSTSSGADVLSTSSGADVLSTSYADWTSVNTDEPQAQTPQFIEESEPAFKVLLSI